jgi:hypothetical protein
MPPSLALLALTLVSAGWWLGAAAQLVLGGRRVPGLGDVEPLADPALPSLAVVAPAKDEAERVERAALSLLSQDYPGIRVIFVDDRSVDGTGAILDGISARRPELRVVHVETLPPGWVGKSHALARGAAEARADWILFTDGDVRLAPDAARRAVSLAIRERADHVAIGPDLVIEGLGEAVFVGFFYVMFSVSQRPWRAKEPRAAEHIGVGAFNLVRREAYERAGGHERIRYDLIDDMALGKLLKRTGARQLYAGHGGRVSARWHAGVRGLIRGVEKNAFPAMGYRAGYTLFSTAALLAVSLAPVAGLFAWDPATKLLAAGAWSGVAILYAAASRGVRVHPWHAAFMPVGSLLFNCAILRSMAITLRHRGVRWRDTFYPLEELKRGRTW